MPLRQQGMAVLRGRPGPQIGPWAVGNPEPPPGPTASWRQPSVSGFIGGGHPTGPLFEPPLGDTFQGVPDLLNIDTAF